MDVGTHNNPKKPVHSFTDKDYVIDNKDDIFICIGNSKSDRTKTMLVYSKKNSFPENSKRQSNYIKILSLIRNSDHTRTKETYDRYADYLKNNLGKYHHLDELIGDICILTSEDIIRYVKPRDEFPRLLDENSELEAVVSQIESMSGINRSTMGVIGSYLFGCSSTRSDIDLLIYGRDASLQAAELVRKSIKTTQGKTLKINGLNVSIHFALNPDETGLMDYVNEKRIVNSRSLFKGKVVGTNNSMFMPAIYELDSGEKVVSYFIKDRLRFSEGDILEGTGTKLEIKTPTGRTTCQVIPTGGSAIYE